MAQYNFNSFILLLFDFQLSAEVNCCVQHRLIESMRSLLLRSAHTRTIQSLAFQFKSQASNHCEKAIPAANLLILPNVMSVHRGERWEYKHLDAKLLQSIENKFNFNSCLWINVSNHRADVLRIYDALFSMRNAVFFMLFRLGKNTPHPRYAGRKRQLLGWSGFYWADSRAIYVRISIDFLPNANHAITHGNLTFAVES